MNIKPQARARQGWGCRYLTVHGLLVHLVHLQVYSYSVMLFTGGNPVELSFSSTIGVILDVQLVGKCKWPDWHLFQPTMHLCLRALRDQKHLIRGSACVSWSDPSHGSTCALKITCGGADVNNWCLPLRCALSLGSPLMNSSEGARRPPRMENGPYLGHPGSHIPLFLKFLLILRVEIRLHRHCRSFSDMNEWFWGSTNT